MNSLGKLGDAEPSRDLEANLTGYDALAVWVSQLENERPNNLSSRVSYPWWQEHYPESSCCPIDSRKTYDPNPWVRNVIECQSKIKQYVLEIGIETKDMIDSSSIQKKKAAYHLEGRINTLNHEIYWAVAKKTTKAAAIGIVSVLGFMLVMANRSIFTFNRN